MNHRYFKIVASISVLLAGGVMLAPARAPAQQQGAEELTRGPVHEAFAASVSFNPEPGILVRTAPPEMIEEIPPEQRLEGDNVAWIPGYWAWDEEQNDFIWISGIWRNLPPGRQWFPGYWGQIDDQSQWTSGYWADEETQEVTYLPRPPKSVESGPNIAAPNENSIWISGNWIHREDRYAWTPGYWEPGQENWTWIPAHYQWTRRGYVFIDGYWDYNVARRGVMFAPVRFRGDAYRRPGYSYTPLLAISLNVLLDHLFVRPTYGHYYFGDYYSPRYRDNGYYDSYSYYSGSRGYDAIYAHNRWEHRDDRNWERSRRNDFAYYRDNEGARPAHTYAALLSRPAEQRNDKRMQYAIAQPLSRYVEQASSGQQFQSVSKKSRDQYVQQRKEIREFSQARQQMESQPMAKVAKGSDKRGQVSRAKLAKSPVVAKRAAQLSGNDAPPKRLSPRASQRSTREDTGKREKPQKADKPGKADADVKKQPGKTTKPDQQDGKDSKADVTRDKKEIPRKEPQTDSKKSRKPDAGPSRKGEGSKPAPDRATKPQADKRTKPQAKAEPKERQKTEPAKVDTTPGKKESPRKESNADSEKSRKPEAGPSRNGEGSKPAPDRATKPQADDKRTKPQAKAEPKERQKAAPVQDRRPEPKVKREEKPQRQAIPERKSPPQKKAAPAPRQERQASEEASKKKDSKEAESSDDGKKGRKKK